MNNTKRRQKPSRIPSYRLHKPSGQAVVTLDGREIYVGRHGTDESRADYNGSPDLIAGAYASSSESAF